MRNKVIFTILTIVTIIVITLSTWAETEQVLIDAYFKVRYIAGSGVYIVNRDGSSTDAIYNMRLRVNESIEVGPDANARLVGDLGTTIQVNKNTKLKVMQFVPGQFIRLRAEYGSFVITESDNGLKTIVESKSAGTVSPDGTKFGITIDPNGKMGVATEEGVVTVESRFKQVQVKSNFQNLTLPNQPPSPPVPFKKNNTGLKVQKVDLIEDSQGLQKLRIQGKIDNPVNLLTIANKLESVGPKGEFDSKVTMPFPDESVQGIVTTPLLEEEISNLWSQSCKPLIVAGGDSPDQTIVQKTVSAPSVFFASDNYNTDFQIPEDQKFNRFWVKVDAEGIPHTGINIRLKYKNASNRQFYAQEYNKKIKYTLVVPNYSYDTPSQVNINIGGLQFLNQTYRVTVFACNDDIYK